MRQIDPGQIHTREDLLAGLVALYHQRGLGRHLFAGAAGLGVATVQAILDGSTASAS